MTGYRIKHRHIVSELYVPTVHNGNTVIFLAGLPSFLGKNTITKKLVDKGCVVFQPYYSGSFDSAGSFQPSSCVRDIPRFIDMATKKTHRELYYNQQLKINTKKIILMGTSYGSSIAALSWANKKVSRVILLSPVLTYNQDFISSIDPSFNFSDQMKALLNLIRKGYPFTYRIKKMSEWNAFLFGKLKQQDPFSILQNKTKKSILIVHGQLDTSIPSTFTKRLITRLDSPHLTSINPKVGHSISSYDNPTIDKIVGFIHR